MLDLTAPTPWKADEPWPPERTGRVQGLRSEFGVRRWLPVGSDAGQQGLQPAGGALAVGVQEGDDLARGECRPAKACPDQARTLLHPHHPHRHLQLPHVLLQRTLQEV